MKKMMLLGSMLVFIAGCGASTTPAPTPEVKTETPVQETTPAAPTEKTFTLAEVQAANSREKCWSAVDGQVYDLTAWIGEHPGGEQKILSICGKDGTAAFQGQHGGQAPVAEILKAYKIGVLK